MTAASISAVLVGVRPINLRILPGQPSWSKCEWNVTKGGISHLKEKVLIAQRPRPGGRQWVKCVRNDCYKRAEFCTHFSLFAR